MRITASAARRSIRTVQRGARAVHRWRLSGDRSHACSTCHPGGEADGEVYGPAPEPSSRNRPDGRRTCRCAGSGRARRTSGRRPRRRCGTPSSDARGRDARRQAPRPGRGGARRPIALASALRSRARQAGRHADRAREPVRAPRTSRCSRGGVRHLPSHPRLRATRALRRRHGRRDRRAQVARSRNPRPLRTRRALAHPRRRRAGDARVAEARADLRRAPPAPGIPEAPLTESSEIAGKPNGSLGTRCPRGAQRAEGERSRGWTGPATGGPSPGPAKTRADCGSSGPAARAAR